MKIIRLSPWKTIAVLGISVLFSTFPHMQAQAATFYVSTGGSDAHDCTKAQDINSPKQHINNAVACLSAGDTLLVRGGTYDEVLYNPSIAGTSWSNKVRIANYNNETVWMTPVSATTPGNNIIYFSGGQQYIEIDGINLDGSNREYGTIALVEPHVGHVRFMNLESKNGQTDYANNMVASNFNELLNITVHGGGRKGQLCGVQCHAYAWYVAGSNNLVEDGHMYDLGGAGVHIYNGHGPSDNNIVRGNRIHDVNRTGERGHVWGILMTGNNNQVYNNLIWDINNTDLNDGTGDGIVVYFGNGNKIRNNTIYGNRNRGIYVQTDASNTEVTNNIAYANAGSPFATDSSTTTESKNMFGGDPKFVNASANDFHLQSGSPAIDKGAPLFSITTDFDGSSRPQGSEYDIGAYESGGSAPPKPIASAKSTPSGANPSNPTAVGASAPSSSSSSSSFSASASTAPNNCVVPPGCPADWPPKDTKPRPDVPGAVAQAVDRLKTAGVFIGAKPDCGKIVEVACSILGGDAGLESKPTGNNWAGHAVDKIAFPDGYSFDVIIACGNTNGPSMQHGCCGAKKEDGGTGLCPELYLPCTCNVTDADGNSMCGP